MNKWPVLARLHVVRNTAKLLSRRWGLGVGYIDVAGGETIPPRTNEFATREGVCLSILGTGNGLRACKGGGSELVAALRDHAKLTGSKAFSRRCHADLVELVAPVAIDGEVVGGLLCGGFFDDGNSDVEASDPKLSRFKLDRTALAVALGDTPRLSSTEQSFIGELLSAAADDIGGYLGAARATERSQPVRQEYESILGSSPPMQELYSLLDRVVASDSTVLITGENGTGKELVARAIHQKSARASQRFVVQNCSAFNDNLLDSELFGHKRGSFTGAVTDKKGLFEIADKGTFFLDEIGDMSPSLQVKVLRVLQEGTFTPVGDTQERHVDVRILAATNRDLRKMVEEGSFREDLYYRINVINLVLPALRDRGEDIKLLADRFLERHGEASGVRKRLDAECLAGMRRHSWPGNVRELENEIERLVVLSGDSPEIAGSLLSERISTSPRAVTEPAIVEEAPRSLPEAVQTLERRMIVAALKRHQWNKTRAAAELQVSRRNLIRLVQKYDLDSLR